MKEDRVRLLVSVFQLGYFIEGLSVRVFQFVYLSQGTSVRVVEQGYFC